MKLRCTAIRRLILRRSKKAGLPPGNVVHVGEERYERVKLSVISYDHVNLQEKEVSKVEEVSSFRNKSSVTWLNIDGVHHIEMLEQVGKHFGLHPFVLEDSANTGQRPKMEDFDDYIFVVLRMLRFDEKENETRTEQISLLLGSDFVIFFWKRKGTFLIQSERELETTKVALGKWVLIISLML